MQTQEKKYILTSKGIHIIGSHFVELPCEIFEKELHEFKIVHRESLIDDLCRWISESQNAADKILMKEDLKTLLNWSDDYILSSNETNMYLNSEYELFNGVCEELIEIAESCKPKLRNVKVTFSDGDSFTTSMAAHLTDQDIKNYYQIGKEFNLGTEEDRMAEVVKVEILN